MLFFQALILEPFKIKKEEEESRIYLMENQKKAQRLLVRAKWRQIKGYLCGERGPWKSRLVFFLYQKIKMYLFDI